MNQEYIVIMAGGVGTRLWPTSRTTRPKQFQDILGIGKTLLQMTYDRAKKVVPESHIYIVTGKQYQHDVEDQLPQIPLKNILLEPSRKNTGPAVLYTALQLQQESKDAVFAMLPADHLILNEDAFIKALQIAFKQVEKDDSIVTLGITPTVAHTGYGYIQCSQSVEEFKVQPVQSFTEKPKKHVAKQYLQTGEYLWNSGMFVWSTKTVCEGFKNYASNVWEVFKEFPQKSIEEIYNITPSIQVDYALLENAQNISVIPVDMGWSDLGNWSAIGDVAECDEFGNSVIAEKVILDNVENCVIRASHNEKLIVLNGLKDMIVIQDDHVFLVWPKSQEQELKALRNSLDELGHGLYL